MSATFSPVVLIHQAAGALLLPPLCLLWLALLGLWFRRRWLVGLALAGIYLLATPQVAWWLTRPLEPVVASPGALQTIDAIVVLGGGKDFAPEYGDEELSSDSLLRVRYASWLAKQLGKPLLVTGGSPLGGEPEAVVMARTLQRDYHLDVRWAESRANTTEENARYSAPLLKAAGVQRIALVSNAWHLRRARALFVRQGFDVLSAPTGLSHPSPSALINWLPSGTAQRQSWIALREWVGIAWMNLHANGAGE
ncbi:MULTISPECIES: YdcF family protein [unclassified Paludibacterium]|uniref:YdcF family protein n=1 Tax=unclassified Paludibacterium TaxID=2618429 RepID=UPI001C050ABB|nr:YdcF family protein [Paludibacterium sp. B53371]BEV70696.1 YdcF family protein [Paludibacterium sp. THUN1379]